MATPKRILVASSEVAPFTQSTALSSLVRSLPDGLQEQGSYDVRVMMPRYGTISEREHHLHEVIRLSGIDVRMADDTTSLKVKVASVPDTSLQVYFMDHDLFARDGIYAGDDGHFEDNPDRAVFFGRSVLQTLGELRWGPDVLHSFGTLCSLVPMLLRTEFAGDSLYDDARTVYTPEEAGQDIAVTDDWIERHGLTPVDGESVSLSALGRSYADAVLLSPGYTSANGNHAQLAQDASGTQLAAFYEDLVNEVAV